MKHLLIFLATLCGFAQAKEASFRVATYNVRYPAKADEASGNPWQTRKKEVAALILRHQFDLVGTQEANDKQLEELQELLPEFGHLGKPYGGKNSNSHNCATFYKKELFTPLDSGVFWFSETPDTPSIGWDATDRRICFWTKFRIKETGQEFFVFNAHFFWRNQIAREKSGAVLVEKIKAIAGEAPVIAMGDFNSTPETPQIQDLRKLLSDAYDVTVSARQGVEETAFSGGVFQGVPKVRIDYLFLSQHFTVKDYQVLSDVYGDGRYPSDHLPVTSLVELKSAPK